MTSGVAGAILVLAATPGRATELRAALDSTPAGQGVLRALALDPLEQRTVEDARVALKTGFRDGSAPLPYYAVAAFGDVPISPRAMADLRSASGAGAAFLVIGIADGAEQASALGAAGVSWVASIEDLAVEFPDRIGRANAAAKEEAARAAAEIAASQSRVSYEVIKGQERAGILPNGGIIMVHANKGGAGKSMLAASISYGLALGSPVAVADMNTSGGYIHGAFAKWLEMRENGGFTDPDELLSYKGLSVLSNRINHADARKIDPEQLASTLVRLIPHDRRPMELTLLPGIRSQREYGIERGGPRTPAQELLVRPEWAGELIDTLRTSVGGAGYVVLDTGDSEVNAPATVMFTRADLLVWVVDCSTVRVMSDEYRHLARLLEEFGGRLRARLLVIANKIADGPERAETPKAPTLAQAQKLFGGLSSGGSPATVVGARWDRRALAIADDEGLPVLAIADEHPDLRLVGDLTAIVNAVNGSLKSTVSGGKKSGLFGGLLGKNR